MSVFGLGAVGAHRAKQGIVVDLMDTTQGYVPGPELVDLVAQMAPAPHHFVIKTALNADAADHINIDWVKKALYVWQNRGFEVVLMLDNLARSYQQMDGAELGRCFPNAALGGKDVSGDPLRNDFINRFSLNSVSILRQLGADCPKTVMVKNEPNLEALTLKSGDAPRKPSSMSRWNYAALLYTTGCRIRDQVPAVQHIWPAALSCLVKFNTDPEGPWMRGFLYGMFDYLAAHGKTAPWVLPGSDPTASPIFEGVALNMEGIVTDRYAMVAARAMAAVKKRYGLTGPNIIGEYGVPGGRIVEADVWTDFRALNAHMDWMAMFKLLSYNPDDPEAYGMVTWGEKDGYIVPKTLNDWVALMTRLQAWVNAVAV